MMHIETHEQILISRTIVSENDQFLNDVMLGNLYKCHRTYDSQELCEMNQKNIYF